MAVFEVRARHTVPLTQLARGRAFGEQAVEQLRYETDFEKRGCYVYSVDFPNGSKPTYVGKTQDQTFGSRALAADTRLRLQNHLNDFERSYELSLWLITQISAPGAPNISDIEHIESWLIYKARERNPELLNKAKTGNLVIPQRIQIDYVLNSFPRGASPKLARDFRKMMGLD